MTTHRTRRWATPAAIAVALSAAALYCHAIAAAKWAVIQGWLDARPGLTRVDLSRPGSTTVPLPQPVATHHHGQSFYLDLGGDVPPGADPLKGLTGAVRVTDESGGEVERMILREGMEGEPSDPGRYPLGTWVRLAEGRYEMTVEVETGAPGLSGRDTTIYSRLFVCELEAVPAMLWGLLSWMAGIPAGIAWLVVAVRVARQYARRPPPPTRISSKS